MRNDHTLLGSSERDRYGACVTFQLADGQLLTITRERHNGAGGT